MNNFEERRQARIERLRERAARKLSERAAAHAQVDQLADLMNGQPILVGHHSERRHRRDLERMSANMRKASALHSEAEELRRRADAAERNRAIFSDDPEAVRKLKDQIAQKESFRARCKAINVAIRAAKRRGGDWRPEARELLGEAGLSSMAIDRVLDGSAGGVPGYVLTNTGAEIRRLRKRLEALESAAARDGREKVLGDVRIVEEENRVRIFFPGKPAEEVRRALKGYGFRWSPRAGAWQAHASERAWERAERVVRTTATPTT